MWLHVCVCARVWCRWVYVCVCARVWCILQLFPLHSNCSTTFLSHPVLTDFFQLFPGSKLLYFLSDSLLFFGLSSFLFPCKLHIVAWCDIGLSFLLFWFVSFLILLSGVMLVCPPPELFQTMSFILSTRYIFLKVWICLLCASFPFISHYMFDFFKIELLFCAEKDTL